MGSEIIFHHSLPSPSSSPSPPCSSSNRLSPDPNEQKTIAPLVATAAQTRNAAFHAAMQCGERAFCSASVALTRKALSYRVVLGG